MRKSTPLCAIAIAVALLASSLALPADRAADRGHGDAARLRAATSAPVGMTIHRLLKSRLLWTLQMSRALRLLEQEPEPQPVYGTQTIIDDPDPAGLDKEGTTPPPPGDGEEDNRDSREEQEDAANEFTTPMTEFG